MEAEARKQGRRASKYKKSTKGPECDRELLSTLNCQLSTHLEARGRIELPIKVLQTFALPLGYRALNRKATNSET
jgi:hypothetical protein